MRNKEIQTIIDEKIDDFIYEKYADNKKCIYSGEVYKEGKLKAGCKFYGHITDFDKEILEEST